MDKKETHEFSEGFEPRLPRQAPLRSSSAPPPHGRQPTLQEWVYQSLQQFFQKLDGQPITNLYDMVLHEVETPLLRAVMRYTDGNETKAAKVLGISRGTLRKKLQQYQIES